MFIISILKCDYLSRLARYRRAFRAWNIAYNKKDRIDVHIVREAKRNRDMKQKKSCFRIWKAYLEQIRFEREIDYRVDETWTKVQRWLR